MTLPSFRPGRTLLKFSIDLELTESMSARRVGKTWRSHECVSSARRIAKPAGRAHGKTSPHFDRSNSVLKPTRAPHPRFSTALLLALVFLQ